MLGFNKTHVWLSDAIKINSHCFNYIDFFFLKVSFELIKNINKLYISLGNPYILLYYNK